MSYLDLVEHHSFSFIHKFLDFYSLLSLYSFFHILDCMWTCEEDFRTPTRVSWTTTVVSTVGGVVRWTSSDRMGRVVSVTVMVVSVEH